MAATVQVAGLATIKVGKEGCADALLEILGYTVNGAKIRVESYFEEVHGDQYGGDQGPPIEMVYLGERATVTLEMSKWDGLVADKISGRLYGKHAGKIFDQVGDYTVGPGTPVFAPGFAYRLVIKVAGQGQTSWDFPRAVPREPMEINKGTRHSVLMLVLDCYPNDAGVLYQPYTGT